MKEKREIEQKITTERSFGLFTRKLNEMEKSAKNESREHARQIKALLIILTTCMTEFFHHNFITYLTHFEHIESNLLLSRSGNVAKLCEEKFARSRSLSLATSQFLLRNVYAVKTNCR